jgi:Flp pilus assembly protein TadD
MTAKLTVLVLLAGLAGCTTPPGFATSGDDDKSGDLGRVAGDIEEHGNSEIALELYRRAVVVSGHTPAAYVQLGDAYLRAKRLGQAAAAYRAAIEKDPGSAQAQLGLGTVLVRQGAITKGLAALTKAAPLVNTAAAYNRLGVAQTIAGQFSDAQATFERGLRVDPADVDIATNLALAEALAGESEKAANMVHAITQHPTVQSVHRRNLVIVLGIIGKSARDARAVAPAGIPQPEFDALFKRAVSIRNLTDPKARAHALGTMQG